MKRPVVLVGEDDASVRLTIEFVLEDAGFEVISTADGEAALDAAKKMLPDAILLDNNMPKLSGREVFDGLRADDSTRHIPVFVLSGLARDAGQWPGAHYVGKPFGPDDLVEQIRRVLG